jgi:hypothetical protein
MTAENFDVFFISKNDQNQPHNHFILFLFVYSKKMFNFAE